MCEQDTFWSLLGNVAHWEFELFLMLLFDVIIGTAIWPFVRKHWAHHKEHDEIHGRGTGTTEDGKNGN